MQTTSNDILWSIWIANRDEVEVNIDYSSLETAEQAVSQASPLAQEYFKVFNEIMNFHL